MSFSRGSFAASSSQSPLVSVSLLLLPSANPLRRALRLGPSSAACITETEGRALPYLTAPLLRWGSSCAAGNGGYWNRFIFLVGPDALIGPFPGGPVCRPYKGGPKLILHPARAAARVAPTALRESCLNPDGRVTDPPLRQQKALVSIVGAGPRPARGRGTPQGGFSCPFGAIHLQPLPYGFQENLPRLGRGGPWASRWDSHQPSPARQSQARKGDRTNCNFGTTRPQWAGRRGRKSLRFCAPETLQNLTGTRPSL